MAIKAGNYNRTLPNWWVEVRHIKTYLQWHHRPTSLWPGRNTIVSQMTMKLFYFHSTNRMAIFWNMSPYCFRRAKMVINRIILFLSQFGKKCYSHTDTPKNLENARYIPFGLVKTIDIKYQVLFKISIRFKGYKFK